VSADPPAAAAAEPPIEARLISLGSGQVRQRGPISGGGLPVPMSQGSDGPVLRGCAVVVVLSGWHSAVGDGVGTIVGGAPGLEVPWVAAGGSGTAGAPVADLRCGGQAL